MLLIATARMAVASVAATSIVAVVAEPAVVTRKAERLTVETRRRSVSAAALADVVVVSAEDVELLVVVAEARAISRAESISSPTPREAKMEEREAVVAVAEDVEEEAEVAADAERTSPLVPVDSPRLRDRRSQFCLTDPSIHCDLK